MVRGAVTIFVEGCKGCELCINFCPQKILHLSDTYNSRGYRSVMVDESLNHCTGCGVCAVICPEAAFTVFREARASHLSQVA